jgi:hypothetical protein
LSETPTGDRLVLRDFERRKVDAEGLPNLAEGLARRRTDLLEDKQFQEDCLPSPRFEALLWNEV